MKCLRCDSNKIRVIDSREGVDGRSVRRRRECESCSYRFTTFERIEESLPMVIKKGGQRESFDRDKVLLGMRRACEKRPVSILDLEEAVKDIESKLLDDGDREVSSEIIGTLVSDSLKALDQVAYVRFASVYKEFSDVNEFLETLRHLSSSQLSSNGKLQCINGSGINGSGINGSGTNATNAKIDNPNSNLHSIKKNSRGLRLGKQLTLIENVEK